MSEKLKPCPHCGSDAILLPQDDNYDCWVYCSNGATCGHEGGMFETESEAVASWNRRVILQWSTTPPMKPGWYWLQRDERLDVVCVLENGYVKIEETSVTVVYRMDNLPTPDGCRVRWLKIDEPEVES